MSKYVYSIIVVALLFVFGFQQILFPPKAEFEKFESSILPDVELLSNNEKTVSLHQLIADQDRIVIFWATWCAPCLGELLEIKKMVAEKIVDPQKLILINNDMGELSRVLPMVNGWLTENKIELETYYDPEMKLLSKLEVAALPFSLKVSGADKKIIWMINRTLNKSDLVN